MGTKKKTEIKEEKKDFLEDLQRVQAEFENYIKRAGKEKEQIKTNAKAELLLKIIQVKENLEKALENIEDEGLKMVYNQITKLLKEEDISEIEAEEFDYNMHEVVKKESEGEKIKEIVQKGYMLKDKILRIAKVVIGGK
ncbi:MAG: nucleotide exchange factor GrpE [Nanoarchaeota archaeon]|jgi:molecular chaperone GrpE|nr:nucleotide exchange factor GrpE [Nanoarchaeota archaeon]|tara:strand:- start:6105 stop:6521 length:417 start_codon:yes stop_codon:yes gene_type:complete